MLAHYERATHLSVGAVVPKCYRGGLLHTLCLLVFDIPETSACARIRCIAQYCNYALPHIHVKDSRKYIGWEGLNLEWVL